MDVLLNKTVKLNLMSLSPRIQRALLSVSDKSNIVDFAKQLLLYNIEILSTGGTAALLRQHQIPVTDVSDYTGFPEIMDGRIKTLHPKIHGGLLGRRGIDDELMSQQQILPIDLLVINLYPFEKTISNPHCDLATAIENIDIGGPAMLRAAAKNYQAVTVLIDPKDYTAVLDEIKNSGATSLATRFKLATKVFAETSRYDAAIANYLANVETDKQNKFPAIFTTQFIKKQDLRYGENPHQQAALYLEAHSSETSIANAQQLQGKELSYNNIADADAALECIKSFSAHPACVIVKHANPCGASIAENLLESYEKAYACDPVSAFGGIIAFNHRLDSQTAKKIIEQQFVEVLIAPELDPAALEILKQKPAIRVLACGKFTAMQTAFDYKRITGGLLLQDRDLGKINKDELKIVTQRHPSPQEMNDLVFAWRVAKFVKSNAIVFAKHQATIGIGAGQMSRVDSVNIAITKAQRAGLNVKDSVMASDAFFPFRDSVDQAAEAGATAIIQPGGSIRDQEVIQAADQAGIAMVFTGMRHFRH